MQLNEEQIRKIARLARLKLTTQETQHCAKDLTKILDWVEQLSQVNTDSVEAMSSVNLESMPMREDVINDGDMHEAILKNAPQAKHDMFVVPKVVE